MSYDDGLGLLVNPATSRHGVALGVVLLDHVVAVGLAATRPALAHAPLQPAPGLLRQVLEKERVHGALQADMQLVDIAFGQGDDADAGER